MSDLHKILKEEYEKKVTITPNLLIEMIEEAMGALNNLSIKSTGYSLTEDESDDVTDEAGKRSEDVTVIRRPVIKITEAWGDPDRIDRQIMEALLRNIQGGSIKEKIKSVTDFLAEPVDAAGGDISKIMSYLIFLDTFASIVNDYGASVTGFLFEAFLAALFGGTSIQVDDPEQVGAKGTLPIEDNQLYMQLKRQSENPDADPEWDLVPYSLKVLRQGGPVHGSFKNLVDFFLDPSPQRKSDSLVYLIVIKQSEKSEEGKKTETGVLKFYEFELTRENFMKMIGAPTEVPVFGYVPFTIPDNRKKQYFGRYATEDGALRLKKAQFPYGPWANEEFTEGMPLYKSTDDTIPWSDREQIPQGTDVLRLQMTGTEDIIKGSASKLYTPQQHRDIMAQFGRGSTEEINRAAFAALKQTKGYGSKVAGGAQWTIPRGVYEEYYQGQLNLDPTAIEAKAIEYTQALNGSLVSIFNSLGALSDNINRYFIAGDISEGAQAKANALELKRAVDEVIPEQAIEQQQDAAE